MIRSFADPVAEKLLHGEALTRKEQRALGGLDIDKAQQRLAILNQATESDLLMLRSLHYHRLHGSRRYSIDANSRSCKWRITFGWTDDGMSDVELVRIEDTH